MSHKKYLFKLVLFVCPLLLFWAALELALRQLPSTHSIKKERLTTAAKDIDTLVLGSSSAFYGIVPSCLDGHAYNLANVSQSCYYSDALLKQQYSSLPKLKRVIFQVNYCELGSELDEGLDKWRIYFYYQAWGIEPRHDSDLIDLRSISTLELRKNQFSLGSLRRGYTAWKLHSAWLDFADGKNIDNCGWWSRDAANSISTMKTEEEIEKVVIYQTNLIKENSDNPGQDSLMQSLLFCKDHNIQAIVVTTPVQNAYRKYMDKKIWGSTEDAIRDFERNGLCIYADFLELEGLQNSDFDDPNHLSKAGAVKFSRKLNNFLITVNQ